jgi:hypothetical protein
LEEKNLNELTSSNVKNGSNILNENLLKQKMESETLINFINNSEQEKNYESKMSDFSKKMVSFLKSPKKIEKNNNTNNKIDNNINNNNFEKKENLGNQNELNHQRLSCDIYIGEFKRGIAEGYGRLFSRSGEWYIGYFKDNKKHGEGEMHFSDGSFYIGIFKNNVIEGEGKYFFKDSSHYSGNFKDGNFCGKGKMAWNDGRKYNGHWENHMLSGLGMHMWANGNIFEGMYKLNIKSSKGVFYWDQSKFYEGDFLNNKLNGKGLFNKGDYLLKGAWKFGKLTLVSNIRLKNGSFTFNEFNLNSKTSEFQIQKAENKEGKDSFVVSNRCVIPVIFKNE